MRHWLFIKRLSCQSDAMARSLDVDRQSAKRRRRPVGWAKDTASGAAPKGRRLTGALTVTPCRTSSSKALRLRKTTADGLTVRFNSGLRVHAIQSAFPNEILNLHEKYRSHGPISSCYKP